MCQVTHFLPSSWTHAADSHEPGHRWKRAAQLKVTFIVGQTATRQTWHQGRRSHFLRFVPLLLSDGARSCDTMIEQETEWGVTVEERCTMYRRGFFGGGISRGDCARLWAVSPEAPFILMFPSELSHAKLHWLLTLIHLGCKGLTALTCSSLFDSFVLRKCCSFPFFASFYSVVFKLFVCCNPADSQRSLCNLSLTPLLPLQALFIWTSGFFC